MAISQADWRAARLGGPRAARDQQSVDELPVPLLAPIEVLPVPEEPVEPDEADGLDEPVEPDEADGLDEEPVEPLEADGLELLLPVPVPLDAPIVDEPVEPVDPLEAEGLELLLPVPDEPVELLPVPPLALALRFRQGLVLDERPVPEEAPMPPVDESEPVPVVPARDPVVPPMPVLPVLELPVPVLPVPEPLELGLALELPDVPPALPDEDCACTAAEATARAALAARRASLWVVMVMWMVLRS